MSFGVGGDLHHCPVLMSQAGTVGPTALFPPAQPAISHRDAPFPGSLCSAPRQDLSLSRGWMPPPLGGFFQVRTWFSGCSAIFNITRQGHFGED